MDGFLIVNKPKGITSQTVCNVIKKKLNTKKVGHNGTLDPNATGVMLVAVGNATKLLKLFNEHDKEYIARIIFGYDSKSLDMESELTTDINMNVNIDSIKRALDKELERSEQIPPIISAIKVNGKKLYQYDLENKEIDIKPRAVKLFNYEIISDLMDFNSHKEIDIKINVSKGYYVRSLARDLGASLGGCAILHELKRTKSGDFKIEDAINLDDITENSLISIFDFLKLPVVDLDSYMKKLVLNGVELDERNTTTRGIFYVRINCDIMAIYEEVSPQKYKPILIFK